MKKSSPHKRTDYLYHGKLYTRAEMLQISLEERVKAEPAIYKALFIAGFMLIGFEMGWAL